MPGSSRLTVRAIRGSSVWAALPVKAMRTRPCRPAAMRRTPRTPASTDSRMRATSSWKNSPAGVSRTWRVVLTNRGVPSSASSWRIDCDRAGWAMWRRSAARPKWRVSATAAK